LEIYFDPNSCANAAFKSADKLLEDFWRAVFEALDKMEDSR